MKIKKNNIKTSVHIRPDQLNFSKLNDIIKEILTIKQNELTSKSIGIITKIIDFKILDNSFQGCGSLKVTLDVTVESVLPQENDIFICDVNMLIMNGILCSFDRIKIWLPIDKLNDFKFVNNVFKKNREIIDLNSKLKIKIIDVRYKLKKFSCIGELLEKMNTVVDKIEEIKEGEEVEVEFEKLHLN